MNHTRAGTDRPRRKRSQHRDFFAIDEGPDGKPRVTRIGTAAPLPDGSWDIKLSAVPLAGTRMQVNPKEEE